MRELIVDNFAGGGGASTGIELAIGRSVDIAINHDPAAIKMHKVNHPDSKHYCEDVWQVDPLEATGGNPIALAWFSPDCKHFSKAKGGKPVEKNIRGLAWVAVKWAKIVRPRVIMLENVEEFKTWGPLKDGYPDPEKKGETFELFIGALKKLGYKVDFRELKACDYGAPTIRKRFFMVARCDGKSIVWPKPTHGNPEQLEARCGLLKPWRTAAEIIDWSIPCPSIFDRKKPLADNTLRRIARGMKKFVIENPKPFILRYKFNNEPEIINKPLSTITSVNGHYVVTPYITRIGQTGFGKDRLSYSAEGPLTTITTKAEHLLIAPSLISYHSETTKGGVRGATIDQPIHTLDTSNRFGLVAAFLAKHYGGNYSGPGANLEEPLPTVTTVDHNALITAFVCRQFKTSTGHKLDEPLGTITTVDKSRLVTAFLLKYYGSDIGQSLTDPLHTITSKDRFGLITIHGEEYQIVDIGMRMLEPHELFAAQGFPENYIIDRDIEGKKYSKSAQVARCGNAVPPPFAEHLVRANLPEICEGAVWNERMA